mgnify:CR=1 FL=1
MTSLSSPRSRCIRSSGEIRRQRGDGGVRSKRRYCGSERDERQILARFIFATSADVHSRKIGVETFRASLDIARLRGDSGAQSGDAPELIVPRSNEDRVWNRAWPAPDTRRCVRLCTRVPVARKICSLYCFARLKNQVVKGWVRADGARLRGWASGAWYERVRCTSCGSREEREREIERDEKTDRAEERLDTKRGIGRNWASDGRRRRRRQRDRRQVSRESAAGRCWNIK